MGKKDAKDAAKKEAKALKQAKKASKGEKKAGKEEAAEAREEDDIEAILLEFKQREERKTAVTINIVDQPSPRSNFSLTALPNGDLLMFGGEYCDGAGTTVYNDLYRWNVEKMEWKMIESPNTPAPRCSHQAVYFNEKLYVFGGEYATLDQFHHYRDLWSLDLKTNTWTEIHATGDCPSARSGHRMCVWRGYMVLFAGFFEQKRDMHWYCDTYIYTFATESWCQVQHKPLAHIPRKRSGHQMFVNAQDDCIYMYGGFSKEKLAVQDSSRKEAQVHDDMWMLDLKPVLGISSQKYGDDNDMDSVTAAGSSKKDKAKKEKSIEPVFDANKAIWSRVAKKGSSPSIRSGAVIVSYKTRAILFGGVYDEETAGHGLHSVFYSDLYAFDLVGGRWYDAGLNENSEKVVSSSDDKVKSVAGAEMPDTVLTSLVDMSISDKSKMAEVGYVGRYFASKYGTSPCPRINPALFIKGHKMYIYGGVTELDDIEIALDDCWCIDLVKRDVWTQVYPGTMSRFAWKGPIETGTEGSMSDDEDGEAGEAGEDDRDRDEDEERENDADESCGTAGVDEKVSGDRAAALTKPLSGENIRDFYSRTSVHWLAVASTSSGALPAGASDKDKAKYEKEIKRQAFSLAEAVFNE